MAKKAETYEAMAERLQGIADKLSDGNLPLEEMIKLYEEGAKLAAKCREMLESYKARLDVIEKQNAENEDERLGPYRKNRTGALSIYCQRFRAGKAEAVHGIQPACGRQKAQAVALPSGGGNAGRQRGGCNARCLRA